MELGSVTLKRIGFFCFQIKHSAHTGSWETRSGVYFALSLFPCVYLVYILVYKGSLARTLLACLLRLALLVQGGGSLGGPLWGHPPFACLLVTGAGTGCV